VISIYSCLLPLILSQIYHNAVIDTYLLSDKAGGDVKKLVFMKERLTTAMIDYSGFKHKSSLSIGGPGYRLLAETCRLNCLFFHSRKKCMSS